jgi:2,3-bisphosphoglycerate-independent phosphoglycerate mutase
MNAKPASHRPKPIVLCILDGWGYRAERTDNALAQANVPTWNKWIASYPHALLETSGLAVGLPDGQMGNSEVGHMNIGSGRVMMQDLPRIDQAIADGSIAKVPALVDFIATMKKSGGTCHLMGLMSPGGVHSHQDHIAALAKILDEAGVPVAVHAFCDGRDTPPSSAAGFVADFLAETTGLARTRIGVVSGRYYAMDRDKRWDRVEMAYNALVDAKGEHAPDPVAAVKASYAKNVTDEFILPTVLDGYAGMKDGDGVLMANFRADRAREILGALLDPGFDGFARARVVKFAAACGMVEYSEALNKFLSVMYPPETTRNTLGEVISKAGLTQLRIAETEKYAHVTFFLNGGVEKEFPGETRIVIPSPKVATYDLQPQMSAPEVTDRIVEAIAAQKTDIIIVNFANGDMVGHTGIMDAAMKAAETVDKCLARLEEALKKVGGMMLVAADHGNLEMMRDPETHERHTQHTTGPVAVILVNGPADVAALDDGRLADIAPTVLALMDLPQPAEMTGHALLHYRAAAKSATA